MSLSKKGKREDPEGIRRAINALLIQNYVFDYELNELFDPERIAIFKEFFARLPSETQKIVRLICSPDCPKEILKKLGNDLCKHRAKKYLMKHGMKKVEAEETLKPIKEFL